MGRTAGDVRADVYVGGDVQGQIAVGNNILQIGVLYGNVVVPAGAGGCAPPVRRPDPLRVVPRPPTPFYGRRAEVALLVAEARAGRAVAVQGVRGIGRSTLLRQVATHADLRSVVHFSARDMTPDDAVQVLFGACYASDMARRPTAAEAMLWLREVSVTVVVDDIAAAAVVGLVDIAPRCGFVVATEPAGAAGVRTVQLSGLAADEARALLEHGLGRPLLPGETTAADGVCMLAGNAPDRVLATAAAARASSQSLTEFAESAWASGGQQGPRPIGVDRHLLDVLAAVPGIVLDERWLASIAGVPDAGARLAGWTASGLVEAVPGAGYRATGWVAESGQARAAVVDHVVRWAQARQGRAHRPSPTVEALRHIQADCAGRGEWRAALDIGTVLDPSYAQSGRWDAWHEVLTTNLTAARAMGDRAAEALALHQLGTRELCLLGTAAAANLLALALAIRKSIGDAHGAAATSHNLSVLPAAPVPVSPHTPRGPRRPTHVRTAVAAGAAVMTAAAATIVITLTTASASVSFEPGGLSFAAQPVSLPGAVRTVALVNHGRATAHLTGIRASGTDTADFELTATTCPTELAADQSCEATVAFTPVAEGPRAAAIAVDMADGTIVAALLSGTGSPPVGPTAAPTAVAFTAQLTDTTSAPVTVTLTAPAGGAQLGKLVPDGIAAADYELVDNTCLPVVMPAGQTCTFGVRFTPSVPGDRPAGVQILGATGTHLAIVPVRGTGTAPATAAPLPAPARATVPQVTGMPLAAARETIAAARLGTGGVRTVASDTVPAGSVVSSDPPAGTSVAIGSAVGLVTSSGAGGCVVPNLVGSTLDAAKAAIAASCAVFGGTTKAINSDDAVGTVVSSDPPAGARIAKSRAIQLVVVEEDEAPAQVKVPNISDDSLAAAKSAITAVGLIVGQAPAADLEHQFGTNPAAGTLVAKGSKVDIVVLGD